MSNSSIPPQGSGETSNVVVLRRPNVPETKDEGSELNRRRSDIHTDLANVTDLHAGIANRRRPLAKVKLQKAAGVRKARPRVDGLTPETSPTIPSIAGGKIGEAKKVGAAIDDEVMSDIRGASQLEKAISGVDLTAEPISTKEAARVLLKLRDDDLARGEFDRTFGDDYLLNTDDEVFMPVAQVVIRIFRGQSYHNYLSSERVSNLAAIVRDPDTHVGKLVAMLENYRRMPIASKRQPAHNAPKGKGRVLKPKKD